MADQVAVNYRKADISPRQRAMLDFAMKVCQNSHAIEEADFTALHAHGFDDEGHLGHRGHHGILRAEQPHGQLRGHDAQPRVLRHGPPAQNQGMTQLRWLLHTAASGLASLGCAGGSGGWFQRVAGQPNAPPLHPCLSRLPAGRMQPWPSHSLLHNGGQPPTYWVAAGLGVQRLDIEDHPWP